MKIECSLPFLLFNQLCVSVRKLLLIININISELIWSNSLAFPLTMAASFGGNDKVLRERLNNIEGLAIGQIRLQFFLGSLAQSQ